MHLLCSALLLAAALCLRIELGSAGRPGPRGPPGEGSQQTICDNPLLRNRFFFCRSTPCVYTAWQPWAPTGYVRVSPSMCPDRQALTYQRKRQLAVGSPSSCTEDLVETEQRCPPTPEEIARRLQTLLGGNFGNTAAPAPSGPRGIPGPKGFRRRRPPPPPPPPLPTVTRDIALVLDASGSVGRSIFRGMVDNIAELMGLLCYQFTRPGGPSDVRLALVVYGATARKVFDFRTSAQTHISISAIVQSIKAAKGLYDELNNGATATAPALQLCYDSIFTAAAGMSPLSSKRIILITDGKSNSGGNPAPIAERLFQEKSVQVFPVGVGPRVNFAELESIRQTMGNLNILAQLLPIQDFRLLGQILLVIKQNLLGTGDRCQRDFLKR